MQTIPTNGKELLQPPRISLRWLPVFRRNLLVWRKLAIPSLVGNIAEPLITLVPNETWYSRLEWIMSW